MGKRLDDANARLEKLVEIYTDCDELPGLDFGDMAIVAWERDCDAAITLMLDCVE